MIYSKLTSFNIYFEVKKIEKHLYIVYYLYST